MGIFLPTGKVSHSTVMKLAQAIFERRKRREAEMRAEKRRAIVNSFDRKSYVNDVFGQHIATVDTETYWEMFEKDRYFWKDSKNISTFLSRNGELKRQRPAGWSPKYVSFS